MLSKFSCRQDISVRVYNLPMQQTTKAFYYDIDTRLTCIANRFAGKNGQIFSSIVIGKDDEHGEYRECRAKRGTRSQERPLIIWLNYADREGDRKSIRKKQTRDNRTPEQKLRDEINKAQAIGDFQRVKTLMQADRRAGDVVEHLNQERNNA